MDDFRRAAYANIGSMILLFIAIIPAVFLLQETFGSGSIWTLTIIDVLNIILSIFIWIALWKLSKIVKSKILKAAVIVGIIIDSLAWIAEITILIVLPFNRIETAFNIFTYTSAPFLGTVALLYGLAFINIKLPIAKAFGILLLVEAGLYLSIIFASLATFVSIATSIMSIIFFFQASRIFGKKLPTK